MSELDARLRFVRDYGELRPAHPHCRESIVRVAFEKIMALALDEAGRSRRTGNKGYGAVVALGDRVLAAAHDTAASEGDPCLDLYRSRGPGPRRPPARRAAADQKLRPRPNLPTTVDPSPSFSSRVASPNDR